MLLFLLWFGVIIHILVVTIMCVELCVLSLHEWLEIEVVHVRINQSRDIIKVIKRCKFFIHEEQ